MRPVRTSGTARTSVPVPPAVAYRLLIVSLTAAQRVAYNRSSVRREQTKVRLWLDGPNTARRGCTSARSSSYSSLRAHLGGLPLFGIEFLTLHDDTYLFRRRVGQVYSVHVCLLLFSVLLSFCRCRSVGFGPDLVRMNRKSPPQLLVPPRPPPNKRPETFEQLTK